MRKYKYQLFDNLGNIVEEHDDRDLESEIEYCLQDLDREFTDTYHVRLGIKNKEKGTRKIQEARLGILEDKAEQKELLAMDKEIKEEYRLRKEMIKASTTCDECNDAIYKPKKLVKKSKLLGLSSEYVLEDKDEKEA